MILDVSDLHVRFKTEDGIIHAVNGVDYCIAKGETFCLVGESGCGKSVTALSVMGLLPDKSAWVESGKLIFKGEDLLTKGKAQMRRIRGNRISMIFQEPMTSLNPVYRIGNQITEALRAHVDVSPAEAIKKAVAMLDSAGIPDPDLRIHEYPHHLSGGMRQRVMIAMALICQPDLLIADEPTTALDVTIQAQILKLISQLKQDHGTAVMLITHDLGVVAEVADTVSVMYAGRIVETAPVKPLFAAPLHPYTQGLIRSIPLLDAPVPPGRKLPVIEGSVPSLLNLPRGCTFSDRCRQALPQCIVQEPPWVEKALNHHVRCWLYA